jgi:hypothetical protein
LYCNNCGAANSDQAKWCSNCGKELSASAQTPTPPLPPGYPPPQTGPRVESYLVHSILVTVFCCLPLGIPAIVYAARVNNKLAIGDISGAMEASGQAKTWCWIALIAGLVFGFGWIGLSIMGMLGNLH